MSEWEHRIAIFSQRCGRYLETSVQLHRHAAAWSSKSVCHKHQRKKWPRPWNKIWEQGFVPSCRDPNTCWGSSDSVNLGYNIIPRHSYPFILFKYIILTIIELRRLKKILVTAHGLGILRDFSDCLVVLSREVIMSTSEKCPLCYILQSQKKNKIKKNIYVIYYTQ
jgi:hypothetical protein